MHLGPHALLMMFKICSNSVALLGGTSVNEFFMSSAFSVHALSCHFVKGVHLLSSSMVQMVNALVEVLLRGINVVVQIVSIRVHLFFELLKLRSTFAHRCKTDGTFFDVASQVFVILSAMLVRVLAKQTKLVGCCTSGGSS
jgi:hypothetical protein